MELPLDAYLIGYADDITAIIVPGGGVETQRRLYQVMRVISISILVQKRAEVYRSRDVA